ncbi:MAG: hypothetical protein EOO54_21990 [Haliea sp.]|nr:MAG: hypothetical protein EOO54_21990 [Haliea sp.]
MRTSAFQGCVLLLALAALPAVHAEVRQCSEHRVDYLIGGASKGAGRTCGVATTGISAPPAARGSGAASAASGGNGTMAVTRPGSRVMTPDDEGRREILQQELDKARASMAALEKSLVPIPGAGTLAEQRARKVSDIASLEAELGRLKR